MAALVGMGGPAPCRAVLRIRSVVRFRVCSRGWYRFFRLPRSDFSPSPLYELSPYRRGGCSSSAKQSKEQQEETGLCPVFPLALRGYG